MGRLVGHSSYLDSKFRNNCQILFVSIILFMCHIAAWKESRDIDMQLRDVILTEVSAKQLCLLVLIYIVQFTTELLEVYEITLGNCQLQKYKYQISFRIVKIKITLYIVK